MGDQPLQVHITLCFGFVQHTVGMEENACHQGWGHQYLYDLFCNKAMLSGATGRATLVDRKKEKHLKQVNNLIRLV